MLALLEGMLLLLVYEAYGHRQQFNSAVTKQNPSKGIDRDSNRAPICEHPTFCEFIPDYPSELVKSALQNNPYVRFYTNGDELDIPSRPEDEPEEQPLCVSTEQIVFPKMGLTKDEDWKYIINHENWTQSVRVETCMYKYTLPGIDVEITSAIKAMGFVKVCIVFSACVTCAKLVDMLLPVYVDEDKPCRVIEGFAEGYITKCRQKYIHRQLWAVTGNGTITRETFRFPTSCCCHIEFQGDKFLKAYRN